MKILSFIASCLLSLSLFAQDGRGMPDIKIGVGGGTKAEVLFLVEADYRLGDPEDSLYLVAADLDMKGGTSLDQIEISLRTLGAGLSLINTEMAKGWIEANLLNVNYQRDLAIDMEKHLRISLIGVKFGGEVQIDDNVRLSFETAMDMLSLGVASTRHSDGASMGSGRTGGHFSIEAGLELFNKVKIELGYAHDVARAVPVTHSSGRMVCDDYYYDDYYYDDYYYSGYTSCYEESYTSYLERWSKDQLYLSIVFNINKRFALMGKASYNIYSVRDNTHRIDNSVNGGWQFFFGAVFRF